MNQDGDARLFYIQSCDLDANVQVKIGSLEGKPPKPDIVAVARNTSLQHCVFLNEDQHNSKSIFVLCQVISDGKEVGPSVGTSYRSFSTRLKWNEWLMLPVKYSELSRDAFLAITLYDYHETTEPHVLGGTCITFFSKRGVFRQGMYDLKVWPYVKADIIGVPCTTAGKLKAKDPNSQMARLAKLSKRHRDGLMHKVDWLDRLTFREIEQINDQEKRESNTLFLMIEFARVQKDGQSHLIMYFERNGDEILYFKSRPLLVRNPDPELKLENLVEAKHHILARSARISTANKDLKPTAKARDHLNSIINYPPTRSLTNEEKDLVWKFRYNLSNNKNALVKFLKTVHWDLEYEVRQAEEMMLSWEPMDVQDALELLSPHFTHSLARRYAVRRLRSSPRDELLLYLLQLVQALKYENPEDVISATDDFLLNSQAAASKGAHVSFEESSKWYDEETATTTSTAPVSAVSESPHSSPQKVQQKDDLFTTSTGSAVQDFSALAVVLPDDMDLSTFLITTAFQDPIFANYLYWYLKVECDATSGESVTVLSNSMSVSRGDEKQSRVHEMYNAVLRRLAKVLSKGGSESRKQRTILLEQVNFVDRLLKIMQTVAKESGNRKRKIECLQAQLLDSDNAGALRFTNINGLPLPLDPEVRIKSIIADKAMLFNSALMPCKLTFKTIDGSLYTTIFKHGDDLRQDQLVLQIIMLMDKLLQKDNLDLKLTPYKVLATSTQHGFVQFVESQPLRDVTTDWNGSILNYFRSVAPSATGPYNVREEVIDNYVKSCAGYSVVCYLLGVGDRHLHNLLLSKNGRLFHVDFGFILGRDPKPMPPPMKLTREMIDGMGGPQSSQWREFCNLCYTAFLHLRRHSNLILNLFSLMVNASIPDIALEPDKAVKKVQERFRLDMNDEEAVQFMQQVINESVNAKMATVVDFVHDMAQYWRR